MNVHCGTALVLTVLVVVPAGQTAPPMRPTDEQITLADVEVRRLVPLLRLEPGMRIADVGAGLGAWTLRFAQWTGPSGHVYSTDISEEQLTALRALAARERLSNVTVIRGAAASTNLPAGCCDAILMRNVFHYVTEPAAMIRSLAESLKPGGRLAVVDFPPRPNTAPPAGVPTNRGGQGVPPEVVESEVGALLRHVTTVPNWAPEGVPAWVPKEIAPPFAAIFEKAR
ncbi:MAG TPA: class I SAM-dependent methyltransferase [Vicinamibacterales bacterium]|nr:class I SAM-dependent methyltransferase [Vicinamibacterales bacterium]